MLSITLQLYVTLHTCFKCYSYMNR